LPIANRQLDDRSPSIAAADRRQFAIGNWQLAIGNRIPSSARSVDCEAAPAELSSSLVSTVSNHFAEGFCTCAAKLPAAIL
jgi:hypothetical protein